MFGDKLGIVSADKTMGYENRLFDTKRVHTIDIVCSDWDSFIETCENEEYTEISAVIDGESYKNIALRAKGNTSLSSVKSMDSDRYSFKIEFDHYDSAKSYYGLDKLSLNNLIQDNTMMKDYLVYQLMNEFSVTSPLCSFVYITVNGEEWGLYLAVEGVEDSFLERNYNSRGELYKPDSTSMGGGRGNGRDFDMDNFMNNEDFQKPENFDFPQRQNGGMDKGGRMGMGSDDVKLKYIDDAPESYSNIFDNAKTDISDEDKTRLINALKRLSEGEKIEYTVAIEEVIRYFVVHNFVVNGDSYTGSIIHNYYLHEYDSVLSMIPWDYNLAFGTFQSSNASSSVNSPIDSPVTSGDISDRPMVAWIFENEDYTDLYHSLYKKFINSVDILEIINSAKELISPYVEKDPSKFCTFEEFEKGVTALEKFCSLRLESVSGQLDSTIPSTKEEQASNSEKLVNTDGLNMSDMGSMGMGGGGFGGKGNRENFPQRSENMIPSDGVPQMPEGMTPPDGVPKMPEGMTPPDGQQNFPQRQYRAENLRENNHFPTENTHQQETNNNALITLGICLTLLIVGIAIVKFYKR